MFYYKILDGDNNLIQIENRSTSFINPQENMIEITKEEYDNLLSELELQWEKEREEKEQIEEESISPDEFMEMVEAIL